MANAFCRRSSINDGHGQVEVAVESRGFGTTAPMTKSSPKSTAVMGGRRGCVGVKRYASGVRDEAWEVVSVMGINGDGDGDGDGAGNGGEGDGSRFAKAEVVWKWWVEVVGGTGGS